MSAIQTGYKEEPSGSFETIHVDPWTFHSQATSESDHDYCTSIEKVPATILMFDLRTIHVRYATVVPI